MKKFTIQASIDELEKKVAAGGSGASAADDVSFDNTGTGLSSDNVQDAIEELNARDNYSTNETIVGQWTDGRPIYRKVLTGLSLVLEWVSTYHTSVTTTKLVADAAMVINSRAYNEGTSIRSLPCEVIITSESWQIIASEDTTITTLAVDYIKAPAENSKNRRKK